MCVVLKPPSAEPAPPNLQPPGSKSIRETRNLAPKWPEAGMAAVVGGRAPEAGLPAGGGSLGLGVLQGYGPEGRRRGWVGGGAWGPAGGALRF